MCAPVSCVRTRVGSIPPHLAVLWVHPLRGDHDPAVAFGAQVILLGEAHIPAGEDLDPELRGQHGAGGHALTVVHLDAALLSRRVPPAPPRAPAADGPLAAGGPQQGGQGPGQALGEAGGGSNARKGQGPDRRGGRRRRGRGEEAWSGGGRSAEDAKHQGHDEEGSSALWQGRRTQCSITVL